MEHMWGLSWMRSYDITVGLGKMRIRIRSKKKTVASIGSKVLRVCNYYSIYSTSFNWLLSVFAAAAAAYLAAARPTSPL